MNQRQLRDAPGRLGPCFRLRGWLTRYIWPSYRQRRFIEDAQRDMKAAILDDRALHYEYGQPTGPAWAELDRRQP
jgi:hypothetical protein